MVALSLQYSAKVWYTILRTRIVFLADLNATASHRVEKKTFCIIVLLIYLTTRKIFTQQTQYEAE